MVNILGFLGFGIAAIEAVKSITERKLPAEYHGNKELENADLKKVQLGEMSKSEFMRNMRKGKYYGELRDPIAESKKVVEEMKARNPAFARLYRD